MKHRKRIDCHLCRLFSFFEVRSKVLYEITYISIIDYILHVLHKYPLKYLNHGDIEFMQGTYSFQIIVKKYHISHSFIRDNI